MLSVPASVKMYFLTEAADLRRSYDGLAAIVQEAMGGNPLSGSLLVFVNKRRNRIKILYWDRDGYAIWMKRLESGTVELPRPKDSEATSLKITCLSVVVDPGGHRAFQHSTAQALKKSSNRPCSSATRIDS